jgi:hypothetical protein
MALGGGGEAGEIAHSVRYGLARSALEAVRNHGTQLSVLQTTSGSIAQPLPAKEGAMSAALGKWYQVRVNKGNVHSVEIEQMCNAMRESGYRLAQMFEQRGNVVMVFEWVGLPDPQNAPPKWGEKLGEKLTWPKAKDR